MAQAPRYAPLGDGPFAKTHADFTEVDAFDWASLGAGIADPKVRDRGRRSFVLRALGGWDEKAPEPQWVRSDKRLPLRRRVLATVIGSLCVGETVSVQMIRGVRESASDPVTHAVLTRMLADESFHSRFGWWWLESTPLDEEERAWGHRYLAKLLPHLDGQMRPRGASPRAYVASPFGSMSAPEREEAFVVAMEKTILPGFDSAGLDASGIWAAVERQREGASA